MHESMVVYRAGGALARGFDESTWNGSEFGLESTIFDDVDRGASAASLFCSVWPHELDFGPLFGNTTTVTTPS